MTLADPVTGTATPVLVVKGSGGDLGTLTADGLARLDLTRLRALTGVGGGRAEDDLVAITKSCRFGIGGASRRRSTRRCTLSSTRHTSTTPIPTR